MRIESYNRLLIAPGFAGVLSGEFLPVTDNKQRTHCALLLAQACVEKGEMTDNHGLSWEYTPSWAPTTHATATVRGGIGSRELTSLTVTNATERDNYLRVEKIESNLARVAGQLQLSETFEPLPVDLRLDSDASELSDNAGRIAAHLEIFYAQLTK